MKSNLHVLELVLHARTAKAVLVSDDGSQKKAKWLPISQIEITDEPLGCIVQITAPEWLLVDKGFF